VHAPNRGVACIERTHIAVITANIKPFANVPERADVEIGTGIVVVAVRPIWVQEAALNWENGSKRKGCRLGGGGRYIVCMAASEHTRGKQATQGPEQELLPTWKRSLEDTSSAFIINHFHRQGALFRNFVQYITVQDCVHISEERLYRGVCTCILVCAGAWVEWSGVEWSGVV
jgi:hypothetical protein